MDTRIGNIVYFGAPKDGFKVYPDVGSAESVFAGYYTSTGMDWILTASKTNDFTACTYVKYGLLTAAEEGREGSCLGVSIYFINSYFADLDVLRREVYEKLCEVFLSEGILLERHLASGKIAFKAYNLNQVSSYLDDKTQVIKKVIGESYSKYILPSTSIPHANGNPIYALHPDSAPAAIQELFETYGVVRLSPNAPTETKSVSQKAEEQIKGLQDRNVLLVDELKRKQDDIDAISKKLSAIEGGSGSQHYVRVLMSAANFIERLDNEVSKLKRVSDPQVIQKLEAEAGQLRTTANWRAQRINDLESELARLRLRPSATTSAHELSIKALLAKHGSKIMIVSGALIVIAVGILFWNLLSSSENEQPYQQTVVSTPPSMPTTGLIDSQPYTYQYDGKDRAIETINGLAQTVAKECEQSKDVKPHVLASILPLNPALNTRAGELLNIRIKGVPVRFETPKTCSLKTQHFSLVK